MNRLRHWLDEVTRAAPYLLAAVATTTAAVVWRWVLGWPLINLAVLLLAAIAAVQEARIVGLHGQLEDHLADHDEAAGPIAPETPETPWREGAGLDTDTLHQLDQRAAEVRAIDGPRPSPRPRNAPAETFEEWLARSDAEYHAALARISGTKETT